MPVAPTQVIEPIEYDKFQVYTIELKNRTSCQNNNLAGKFCILGLLWHTENSKKKIENDTLFRLQFDEKVYFSNHPILPQPLGFPVTRTACQWYRLATLWILPSFGAGPVAPKEHPPTKTTQTKRNSMKSTRYKLGKWNLYRYLPDNDSSTQTSQLWNLWVLITWYFDDFFFAKYFYA